MIQSFYSTNPTLADRESVGITCDATGATRTTGGGTSGAMPTVTAPSATSADSSVAQNAASVQLLAANTARRGFIIRNDSTAAANLFIRYGTTATTAQSIMIGPGITYFNATPWDGWTGRVDGIWDAAGAGNARITEISP